MPPPGATPRAHRTRPPFQRSDARGDRRDATAEAREAAGMRAKPRRTSTTGRSARGASSEGAGQVCKPDLRLALAGSRLVASFWTMPATLPPPSDNAFAGQTTEL